MRVMLLGLSKRFGTVTAVDNLDLEINSGEFVAFLGPSGCGKTTTLLMVAGIYKPTEGGIVFGERRVEHLLPKDRGIGMVFQSYALYPHMTVAENIGFPLELRGGISKTVRDERVREAAARVQVDHLLARRPAQLSGGQQQRVALARALVKRPDVLLLDEPLSNLDARLRHEVRGEIKRLQKDLGITSIFVTHDQVEALTMADRVALLRDGQLQAYAPPEELYARPRNKFVAEFVGTPPMNLLPAHVSQQNGTLQLKSDVLELDVPAVAGMHGDDVTVGIRPEDVSFVSEDDADFRGEVYVSEPIGREQIIDVRNGNVAMQVLAPAGVSVSIGEQVGLRVDRHKLHLFDGTSGERLN